MTLERPGRRQEREFLELVGRSRALHGPWVTPPRTKAGYASLLRRSRRRSCEAFFVRASETGELAGAVWITEIVRGVFRSGYLSYHGFAPTAGRGLMGAGLAAVIRKAFRDLGLHRLEANIRPGNRDSIRLVRRLGFRREGFSPRYLRLGGCWRDHERWAILAEEFRAGRGGRARPKLRRPRFVPSSDKGES
ncbi:MAG TPA: GNAT family N-acetyltransferase [Acidobacteriota bacterium]|nr:GNAT family N-acetyltransferase [Acidobacteriota bacterium]